MRALFITSGILIILFLLAITRHGVSAEYSEDGIYVTVKLGFFRIRVIPFEKWEKALKLKNKKKKEKMKEKPEPEPEKKGGALENVKSLIPAIKDALGSLRRKLSIDLLTVRFTAAGGENPYMAALAFGGASAGFGFLIPLLENFFIIKNRDLRASVDFNIKEPSVYVKAQLTMALWEIVYIGARFAIALFKVTKASKKRKVNS